ncbi:acyl carrier protein [Micromonospora cathayae]|uniref:Acyl carrier protein n=1 Tax=Micromonospora cathayae TaxID=3028804 RepID=A0ABY7ZKQ0_9ACTN|nr:acyl carrier protein [Micromonospora sp. HUAS 3]WDZ83572.1 acyl carrier protein [Micromonospora sp. HUAS 3]
MTGITLDTLRDILVEAAGADESTGLDGDILDTPFRDLGYDSLALIETAARLRRRYGVEIPDEQVTELDTPRKLLDFVDAAVAAR